MTALAPQISIVIPARDEASYLPACLAAIKQSAHYAQLSVEIIVVLNRCTDQTATIAEQAGCRTVVNDARNLSSIRNSGVHLALADYIITIDADTNMSENVIKQIYTALTCKNYLGGSVLSLPDRYSPGIILTSLVRLPLILLFGIGGGVFFFRKQDFIEIGGFDESLLNTEDINLAKKLIKHARRKKQIYRTLISCWVVTSCRKFDAFGDWYVLAHPLKTLRRLTGKDSGSADEVWYDFPRK